MKMNPKNCVKNRRNFHFRGCIIKRRK